MYFKHHTLITIAGLVWLSIGIFLLSLGLNFILQAPNLPSSAKFSILEITLNFILHKNHAILFLLIFGLLIGLFKGRMILSKTVNKQVDRILALPNPTHIKYLYKKNHYFLIAFMMSLGMILRYLPITIDTRGFIDIAIGTALIHGSILYFRSAINANCLKKGF
ncbi:MAG: hypothetical protein R3E91_01015 [Chlamydiales bacterium]